MLAAEKVIHRIGRYRVRTCRTAVGLMKFGIWLLVWCASSFLQGQVLGDCISSSCEALHCKERLQFGNKSNAMRRSNSGVTHGYTVEYHRLQFWVNPRVGSSLRGITKFGVTVVGDRDSLGFDLVSGMQVDSAWDRGGKLIVVRAGNAGYIRRVGGWKHGDRDSFWVAYSGNPVNGGGFGYYVLDNHKTGPVIHTLSQPYGAQFWWACKQSLHDKIDSLDLEVVTDTGMRAAGNGSLVLEESIAGGTQMRYVWKHRYPIPAYLVAIAVTNYSRFTDTVTFLDGRRMPVVNYCFPQFLSTWQQDAKGVLPLLRMMDSLFIHYPFDREKYGHAQFTWGGGMEHQTMSFMVDLGWDLMAHELAHQWFGDWVTCANWGDLWLNEGFATYVNALAHEFLKGEKSFTDRLKGMRDDVTSKDWGSVFATDTLSVNVLFSGRLTYNKGAWVLHMLRDKVGDSVFFLALRKYLTARGRGDGFADQDDFRGYMEREYGYGLDTFFNEWIDGGGFPYLNIDWKQRKGKVSVKIAQHASDPSVAFFHTRVPILFRGEGKEMHRIFYLTDTVQVFEFDPDFSVGGAEFDPQVRLLAKAQLNGINLDAMQEDAFVVMPNPAVSDPIVVCRNRGEFDVKLFDIAGRLLWSGENVSKGEAVFSVPTRELSAGTYFLKINDQNFVHSLRFQKQ